MAIKLTCPSCESAVAAKDRDRGTTIRCGICWADVAVPGVAPAAAVALAPKPAAAVPAVAAKSVPVAARPVVAVPVKSLPVAAKPAIPVIAEPVAKRPAKSADDERPRPKRRRDEDDDEPNEQYRDAKKGGNTVLILLLVLGGVFAVGLAGVGYAVYRASKAADRFADDYAPMNDTSPEMVDGATDDIPQQAGQPNGTWPPPGMPAVTPRSPVTPPKPTWEKTWRAVPAANGFTAQMPASVLTNFTNATIENETLRGRTYTSEECGLTYTILWVDVPDEFPLDAEQYADKVRNTGAKPDVAPVSVLLGTMQASQVSIRSNPSGEPETVRSVKVGARIFLACVAVNAGRVRLSEGLDPAAKTQQFFDSIQITHNPFSRAPQSTRPKLPKTPNPSPPYTPPAATTVTPGPIAGATGGIVVVGQIERFVAGVALAERQEIWTFDVKTPLPTSPGLLRRYSSGSLKLLATLELPGPVTHAAIDEKAGRLYVAVVTKGGGGFDYFERLNALTELHVYDVKALAAAVPGPIKPLAVAKPEGKITGLVAATNGKSLYAATVVQLPSKKSKAKLVKYNAATLAPEQAPLDLPQPVAVLRQSPDGKRLIAAEVLYNAAGNFVRGFNAPSQLQLVDAVNWKLTGSAILTGLATDVQFVDENKAIAVVPSAGAQTKLYAIDSKGNASEASPAAPGFRSLGLAFAVAIPETNRLILSANVGSGVEVLDVSDTKAKSVGHAAIAPQLLIAGPAILADPEGKIVAFGTGAVLNVSAANVIDNRPVRRRLTRRGNRSNRETFRFYPARKRAIL